MGPQSRDGLARVRSSSMRCRRGFGRHWGQGLGRAATVLASQPGSLFLRQRWAVSGKAPSLGAARKPCLGAHNGRAPSSALHCTKRLKFLFSL